VATGVDGLYGRDAQYEAVVAGVAALVTAAGREDAPTRIDYPPMQARAAFDRIGYLRNFPELIGAVFTFAGSADDHRVVVDRLDAEEPYADLLQQTEVVLTPACCHPLYPSQTGRLPDGGRVLETSAYCFRHEPSPDPMRMQAFRQHEHVRLGTPDEVVAWRSLWSERAPELLGSLGLDVVSDVANDPFFGRAGRLMKMSQREQELKTEFLVNVYGDDDRTACASINYHQDHFGHLFDIVTTNGGDAHSSCIGFGLDRCAVALFARHGTDVAGWPGDHRDRLGLR